MQTEIMKGNMSLETLLDGGMKPGADLGPADVNTEGGFRRGYHHCAADLAALIEERGPLTAEEILEWVEVELMQWRKDVPLERKIMPPALPKE